MENERSAVVVVTGIAAITKRIPMGKSLSTVSYHDVIIVFEIDLYRTHEGLMITINNLINKLVITIHDIIIIIIISIKLISHGHVEKKHFFSNVCTCAWYAVTPQSSHD